MSNTGVAGWGIDALKNTPITSINTTHVISCNIFDWGTPSNSFELCHVWNVQNIAPTHWLMWQLAYSFGKSTFRHARNGFGFILVSRIVCIYTFFQ